MITKKLKKILGSDFVEDGSCVMQEHCWCGSAVTPRMPECVAKPQTREQLQKTLRAADEAGVPVYPLSSAAHFLGSADFSAGGIALDLRAMDRILAIDERNRTVRLEPGVTFGRLHEELAKHNLQALNPFLPHRDKSVLTSSMEREPMVVPKTEYGEKVLTMEVVFPSGNVFRTGSASVGEPGETQADLVGFTGPGIDYFRLFKGAQGTFGIVTWINMKAPCRPVKNKYLYVPLQELNGEYCNFLYAIQKKMIGAECLVLNRFNLSVILSEMGGGSRSKLAAVLPPYLVILCLSGMQRLPEIKIDYEEKAVRTTAAQYGLTPEEGISGVKLSEDQITAILTRPWNGDVYWKEVFKKGFCEIFFYAPLKKTSLYWHMAAKEAAAAGYAPEEIGLYVQPIERARAAYIELRFHFDPLNSAEKTTAVSVFEKCSQKIFASGGHFIRPYSPWDDMVFGRNPDLKKTIQKMKSVFDPNGILNPPVFCF